uniref:DUF1415 family protein n=1 Tax=Neptunomonas sp. TaxID=1971898 RepID=UPI0035658E5E
MKKNIEKTYSEAEVISFSRQWVETIVVGLNLCPFASPVIRKNTLRYAVSESEDIEALEKDFLYELNLIQEADEKEIATTLLIMPRAVADLYDYLDLLAHFERLLAKTGL